MVNNIEAFCYTTVAEHKTGLLFAVRYFHKTGCTTLCESVNKADTQLS